MRHSQKARKGESASKGEVEANPSGYGSRKSGPRTRRVPRDNVLVAGEILDGDEKACAYSQKLPQLIPVMQSPRHSARRGENPVPRRTPLLTCLI
jgi:hypothetical protein